MQNLRYHAVTQAGQYEGLWLVEARTQFHIFIHPTAVHRSHSLVMTRHKSHQLSQIPRVPIPELLAVLIRMRQSAALVCAVFHLRVMAASSSDMVVILSPIEHRCSRIRHCSPFSSTTAVVVFRFHWRRQSSVSTPPFHFECRFPNGTSDWGRFRTNKMLQVQRITIRFSAAADLCCISFMDLMVSV